MEEAKVAAVVIEDDRDIRALTEFVLAQAGFEVHAAEDGPAGIELVREHNPVLTTLDVTMPGMDGFAVAKALREFSRTYLIMVTALAEEVDVVHGFEAGADDYLVKPFRPRELRARAGPMLTRRRREPSAQPESGERATDGVHRLGGLVLDTTTSRTTLDGRAVDLSRPELALLTALMSSGRRVRGKADLVLAFRDQPQTTSSYFVSDADKDRVDVDLASLRRKFGDDGERATYIESVHGIGYRMAEPR